MQGLWRAGGDAYSGRMKNLMAGKRTRSDANGRRAATPLLHPEDAPRGPVAG